MSEQRIYSQSVTDHTLRQWETLRQSHLDSVVFDLSSMSLEEAGAERQKGTRKSLIKIVDPRVVGHTIVRDESGMKTPMGIPFIGQKHETINSLSHDFADNALDTCITRPKLAPN